MTKSFLNIHFFRFQKKTPQHLYSVSSAIQWICKAEICNNPLKKIWFRQSKRSNTSKLLTARILKGMLKRYYFDTDKKTAIFGNIITLSNCMF